MRIGLRGDGAEDLLGAELRYENYVDAHLYLGGVKEVYNWSPAHVGGLIPFQDFILGTSKFVFKTIDDMAKYVEIN